MVKRVGLDLMNERVKNHMHQLAQGICVYSYLLKSFKSC